MPTYDWYCATCKKNYEHIKSMSEYTGKETCPTCDKVGERLIGKIHLIGTKVEDAKFNEGLNCVVKSKKDRKEKAKRLNVEEVGNDFKSGESMDLDYTKKLDEKLKKSWENV